jgi:inositol transport system ATP-binding protein
MGLLTEDRKLSGLFLPLSVQDNMVASNIDTYVKRTGLDFKRMAVDCEHQRSALNVKTPSLDQIVVNLSGGNQQNVFSSISGCVLSLRSSRSTTAYRYF